MPTLHIAETTAAELDKSGNPGSSAAAATEVSNLSHRRPARTSLAPFFCSAQLPHPVRALIYAGICGIARVVDFIVASHQHSHPTRCSFAGSELGSHRAMGCCDVHKRCPDPEADLCAQIAPTRRDPATWDGEVFLLTSPMEHPWIRAGCQERCHRNSANPQHSKGNDRPGLKYRSSGSVPCGPPSGLGSGRSGPLW